MGVSVRVRRARCAAVVTTGLLVGLAAACTASPAAPPTAPPTATAPPGPADRELVASVTQFRFGEGTRDLSAGVTNHSRRDVEVSRATIDWDGLDFPAVSLPADDALAHPGQTAAFTIAYGAPHCARPPAGPPVLVAVVDGRTRRLPLRVEDPELLERFRVKACARRRLDDTASVRLRLATRTVRRHGEEYLPGAVVIRRRARSGGPVRLVDLGGSVLLDLVPRRGPGALPGELRRGRATLVFPVLLGSAHRCDAHATSQSSQTFLISGYARLGDGPTQRLIFPLDTARRDQLTALVHRDCREDQP